jgi:hypothetical protein
MAIDQRNISASLRFMDDRVLQQYAAMHKNDPYVFPLVFQESQNRKALDASKAAQMGGQEMPKVNDAALMAMTPQAAQPMPEEMMANNTQALGILIFGEYVYAFEVAGVILLVAIIAAVALTLRNRKDSKAQNIHDQVNVVAADRMRIVKMDSDMAAKQDSRGEKQ